MISVKDNPGNCASAVGGTRTRTGRTPREILSLLRLPFRHHGSPDGSAVPAATAPSDGRLGSTCDRHPFTDLQGRLQPSSQLDRKFWPRVHRPQADSAVLDSPNATRKARSPAGSRSLIATVPVPAE